MTNLKRIGVKATAVLAIVTVLAASAVPAQANPNISFSFSFGNGGYNGGYVQPRPPVQRCMPNQRIINRLHNQGYDDVRFENEYYRGFPQFRARYGRWLYTLQVNRCTGEATVVNRVRPQVHHNPPQQHWNNRGPRPFGGGGFGIFFRN